MVLSGVGEGPGLVQELKRHTELGDIGSDVGYCGCDLQGHGGLLLVRRAGGLPAVAQATVRVQTPAGPAPITLAYGLPSPRLQRSDTRRGVAGCRPPLPTAGQGELALGISPWPAVLQGCR